MIRKDGLYVSKADIIDHDLDLFVLGIEFTGQEVIKYNTTLSLKEFRELKIPYSKLMLGKTDHKSKNVIISNAEVKFSINYYCASWSEWNGRVSDNGLSIDFSIINSDFDEIQGAYEFVQCNAEYIMVK